MENATFTAPENAAVLAAARAGGGGAGGGPLLPALLVALLPPLGAAGLAGSAACVQCLHGCLALLMNLTHGTTAGGVPAVAAAGGGAAIVELLRQLLPGWEAAPAGALRAEVRRGVVWRRWVAWRRRGGPGGRACVTPLWAGQRLQTRPATRPCAPKMHLLETFLKPA
ncbi:MAG: hypothetical protein J3K34DRAFT_435390 [Monoraphidium minutum]|nr:MAG: hypothetical protein J3K34DRAFT_435390 [Monoraphidium minutum]